MSDRLTLKTASGATNELIVEDSAVVTNAVYLGTRHAGSYVDAGVHLSGKDIAKLIDRLEPLAKRSTAFDIFDELPIGSTFKLETDGSVRLKVTATRYIVTKASDAYAYNAHTPGSAGWASKSASYITPTASA